MFNSVWYIVPLVVSTPQSSCFVYVASKDYVQLTVILCTFGCQREVLLLVYWKSFFTVYLPFLFAIKTLNLKDKDAFVLSLKYLKSII